MKHPISQSAKSSNEVNKLWSIDEESIRRDTKVGIAHPDEGLESRETEALGSDAYRDPHQEHVE